MATHWPTPLIQLLATSEDQVDNVYRPLQAMAKHGPLADIMRVGEEFIRLPGDDGRVDVVTSSALSRLGNPIIFALQDETGLYTSTNKMIRVAETQRRGAAGMGGRSLETTNAPDPSEGSVAQRTLESQRPDIFKFHEQAPSSLSYTNKAERRKIHRHVYRGAKHIDLDAIEAEAAELLEKDPAQAERFFGNRLVSGAGSWMDPAKWDGREAKPGRTVTDSERIVLGFDGSDTDDWTGFRAETLDGYQFTPTFGPDDLPTVWNPADYGGQVPRLEVDAALEYLMARFDVARLYADPPGWESEVDGWSEKHGEKVVIRWYTRRIVQMHDAAERLITDVTKADSTFTHDGCETTSQHVANTRKSIRPGKRYVLGKASQTQKIDLTVCSILAHEAANDAIAAGLARPKKSSRMLILR
jgi:phage terminase large subunit-like protein